jgi:hypothetical protein
VRSAEVKPAYDWNGSDITREIRPEAGQHMDKDKEMGHKGGFDTETLVRIGTSHIVDEWRTIQHSATPDWLHGNPSLFVSGK